jgi:hypothetical protein
MLPILLSAGLLIQPASILGAAADDCYTKCILQNSCHTRDAVGGPSCADDCRRSCEKGWGALAYSWKDKIWGYSYAQESQADAERVAMQGCIKQGGVKCILQASFNFACGAVAADGDLVAWGTDSTKFRAQQRALAECAKIGGKKCAVEAAICPDPNAGPPGPLPKEISWGAIAYSAADSGAGWSQGKADRASAEKAAMDVCSQRGKACVLRAAFNKQCGALATDRDITGLGTSANARDAQQQAIAECRKAGGSRCVLRVFFCSF